MKALTDYENYVYTYTCPITGVLFYVGEGKGYRAWSHLKPSSIMPYDVNYPSHYGYIKKLHLLAQEPIVELIFEGTKEECLKVERDLIAEHKTHRDGGTLLQERNENGLKGIPKKWTQQGKERYRELCKERRKFGLDEETLRQEYVVLGMTRREIAEKHGCSQPLVKSRLREYKIYKV